MCVQSTSNIKDNKKMIEVNFSFNFRCLHYDMWTKILHIVFNIKEKNTEYHVLKTISIYMYIHHGRQIGTLPSFLASCPTKQNS